MVNEKRTNSVTGRYTTDGKTPSALVGSGALSQANINQGKPEGFSGFGGIMGVSMSAAGNQNGQGSKNPNSHKPPTGPSDKS